MAPEPRRITLVADEVLGYTRTGGIGTATTFLALALGRMGHRVDVLYTGAPQDQPLSAEWAPLYEHARVTIRQLPRGRERIEPSWFAQPHDVALALAEDPPDVVIAQDLAAPAYVALRLRQTGRGFGGTLFVVYCHGGRRWITDTARKVRVLPGAHAITILEQAAVELADVVVSPSEYLLDWMRGERWKLPDDARVIPYLTRAAALGESVQRAANGSGPVERIAFFGRLEERKGLRPFAAALNALPPELLRQVELEFVGAPTPAWPPRRVAGLFSRETKEALRGLSFETTLDQPGALARLSRRGTLTIVPSLGETFSNAVFECLEHGIPFLASDAGAPRELVAEDDRARVLFAPTVGGIEGALRRALSTADALKPARPAFQANDSFPAWADVAALRPRPRPAGPKPHLGDDWTIVGDAECDADALVSAQAETGADVVTCGVRLPSGATRFFLGDPGALGLVANHYGTVALLRRSHLRREGEPMWPLLAGLAAGGASIVSIPEALATQSDEPADAVRDPEQAMLVVREAETVLPPSIRYLARLSAGLAVIHERRAAAPRRSVRAAVRRLLRR